MKSILPCRTSKAARVAPATIEMLEDRRLLYAPVPHGYSAIETVQIRPLAATYSTDMTLVAGQTYFLRATGFTRTAANVYDGDAAYETTTTTTTTTSGTWGITTDIGSLSFASTSWGAQQGDNIYGQTITPTATGPLSFVFGNDGTDKISTLAVTVYTVVPHITAATINADNVSGSVAVSSLGSQGIFLPLNDADWDNNGVADDKQSGRVVGDKFLVPITLPALVEPTSTSHLYINAPHGVRVWLNADRTGSTVRVGLRTTSARTVYLEGYAEQPKDATVNLQISLPVAGTSFVEDVPVTVFALSGPFTATGGSKQVFSSDSPTGHWTSATGGTLDTSTISTVHQTAYANVVWNDAAGIGYANFEADADYLWGWPVQVST